MDENTLSDKKAVEQKAKEETIKYHALRTYSSDMAKALKQNQGSVIKIAVAEQDRKRTSRQIPEEDRKKRVWLKATLVTVVLGFLVLGGAWYFNKPKKVEVRTNTVAQSGFIFTEKQKVFPWYGPKETVVWNINSGKKEMINYVNQMMTLSGVNVANQKADMSDLSLAVFMNVSKTFTDSVVKNFMLGVDSEVDGAHIFMIIEAESYESLFPGMINWEKTLLGDVKDIFEIDEITLTQNTNTTWQDKIVNNKDMRILKNSSGETVLLYGYAESNIVILTDNQETFDRVLKRLQDRPVN